VGEQFALDVFGVLGADSLVWPGLLAATVLFSYMHCCARTFVVILLMGLSVFYRLQLGLLFDFRRHVLIFLPVMCMYMLILCIVLTLSSVALLIHFSLFKKKKNKLTDIHF